MKLGQLKLFLPIGKVDVERREVWGQAVAEVADKAQEIFDYATSLPLFRDWSAEFEKTTDGKSLGNIRAMHGKVAAGKVIAFQPDDARKVIDIGTKIVDDGEWAKVIEGVYTGFSIGGSYVKRWKDGDLTRYTAAPSEISLVDNPCVPTATFAMVKADGTSESKPFQRYGVLKAAIAKSDLTNGELYALATDYLPASALGEIAKADGTMADLRTQLVKLAESEPEPEPAPAPVEDEKPKEEEKPVADPLATPPVEAAPPVEPEPAKAARPLVRKSMWSIGRFADVLSSIASIAFDAQCEADYEKDGSKIPEQVRAWIATGVGIFKAMSSEEADELLASVMPAGATVADGTEKLAKYAGADLAKRNDELTKALAEQTAELAKVAGELSTTKTTLDEMAKVSAALLEKRRGALMAVPKHKDEGATAKVDADVKPGDSVGAMKKVLQGAPR